MKYFFSVVLFSLFAYSVKAQSSVTFPTKRIAELEKKSNAWRFAGATSRVADKYDITYDRCEWNIDPARYFISGEVTAYLKPTTENFAEIDFDFASNMQVDSIKYHGLPLSYSRNSSDVLAIPLPASIPNGVLDSVSIYYQGEPRSTGFGSFFQFSHNGTPVIWTLSEPNGAEDWWPCKQTLNDKIDSIDIIVTCPKAYRDGSNGVLISETESGDDKIYHWRSRYPIAAYLVAIAVTNYATYSDYVPLQNGDSLQVLNYVYPEDLNQAEGGTRDLIKVIELYDSLFIEYPFAKEKYGHAEFSWGGGMEHQTMTYVSGFDISLLDHECGHQWFGDRITCGSWSDIWLNEGWATYCEGLVNEHIYPYFWKSWKYITLQDATSVPNGSVYCPDTTDVNRIFNSELTYSKGAYLLHMLRWIVGDTAFFQGVRNYLNDPALAYGYARTADLQRHLEETSGKDLTDFFNQWFYGQGYPSYFINYHTSENSVNVTINQSQSDPSVSFFAMPVPVEFRNGTHDTTVVFDNTFSGQSFDVNLPFTPALVTFDPDLWILSANNLVTAVNDPKKESDLLQVFPNLASNSIFVLYKNASSHSSDLQIINAAGALVEKIPQHAGANNTSTIQIDISALSSGVYFVKLTDGDIQLTKKFVKK